MTVFIFKGPWEFYPSAFCLKWPIVNPHDTHGMKTSFNKMCFMKIIIDFFPGTKEVWTRGTGESTHNSLDQTPDTGQAKTTISAATSRGELEFASDIQYMLFLYYDWITTEFMHTLIWFWNRKEVRKGNNHFISSCN